MKQPVVRGVKRYGRVAADATASITERVGAEADAEAEEVRWVSPSALHRILVKQDTVVGLPSTLIVQAEGLHAASCIFEVVACAYYIQRGPKQLESCRVEISIALPD